ncbi:Troponin C, isoform [Seminavis robusta]|uniref:Calmodulin n=1 Tax=Seminavis robusta TaxID=568900 RepID=A0A9N8DMP7_9STRA|nr:Troponin C, isoform [Seminavis robusta]|eukprot:Sro165_g073790.1 Troponin C, isoform (710) ;mRNA; f:25532-27766
MMSKRTQSPSSLPWKAVLLGGIFGSLLTSLVTRNNNAGVFVPWKGRLLSVEPEEAHGSSLEEEEEELEGFLLDSAIAVITLVLLLLTILFETIKEGITERAERSMEPVIEGMFGELTVLGFLSMITTFMVKLGWFGTLADHVGFQEEEEELMEIFEAVHYMLFFIMVFFVINVLVLMYGGKIRSKTWWLYDQGCRDKKYMKHLDAVLQAKSAKENQTTFCQYFGSALIPWRSYSSHQLRSELQLFRGLRHEFVLERSLEPPFAPNAASDDVGDEFQFGSYLTICQSHYLAHMVHLSRPTWVFMAVVTIIFYAIAIAVDSKVEPFAWIWAGTGWLVFVLGSSFDYHMVQLITCMASRFPEDTTTKPAGEDRALLSTSSTASLPQWTAIDLAQYLAERPLLSKWLVHTKHTPTRQDTLYWLGRKGPKLYTILFQIQMLFTAAYISLLVLKLLPYMLWQSQQINTVERIVYPIVSLLPVYLILSKYQVAAANLTMACSVGVHRKPHIISQVNRAFKVGNLIYAVVLLHKLQLAAHGDFATPSTGSGGKRAMSEEEMAEAMADFDKIDADKSGTLSTDEIGNLLEFLGAKVTKEALAAIVKVLDKDGSGSISRQEFAEFYRDHIMIELDDHNLHKLAKEMFGLLDADGNGEVTLTELKTVLDSYQVGMTLEDIAELINEIDEQENGTISEHETVHLLKKHRHLFDRTPLPKLE